MRKQAKFDVTSIIEIVIKKKSPVLATGSPSKQLVTAQKGPNLLSLSTENCE